MGSRTKGGGLLLPLVLVGGIGVVAYQNGLLDGVLDDGVERITIDDVSFVVADDAASSVERCTKEQIVSDRVCDERHVLLVDAAKMPFIARNTNLAWSDGHPGILTMNRSKQNTNRAAACPRSFPRPHGGSCDEYPMASTDQGGAGARAEEVPTRENLCQGGSYGRQYPKDGEDFLVVIINPDDIASEPFTGTDIAKEQGSC
ncbi:NucA/NucB deoxyribonuclease domain-containing protein [Saccharothrix sp.]|uniref:NucA/NucB deoxyribonuclease domain-containing protein n=1 Tax=Saccharothrix sp. TaxID=1873460 RepID=UPI0028115BCF|nr:NucA/NucB deoxyribonuclease domain-containing protein [Saccharothrix sp.]